MVGVNVGRPYLFIIMPIYEYKCNLCGYEFSQYQGIKEEPLQRCPKCGGKVERIISGSVGLIFKGSGFYETDYKRKKEKPEKKQEPASLSQKNTKNNSQNSKS